MKIQRNFSIVIMLITSLVILVSCTEIGLFDNELVAAHKKHKVNLEVNSDLGKLVVTTKPIGACNGNFRKDGCVEVPHNQTSRIEFKLHGPREWQLTKFEICAGIEPPSPKPPCTLEVWQQSEFAVSVKTGDKRIKPMPNGEVNLRPLSDKTIRKFYAYDYNGTRFDYYYIITACKNVGDDDEVCLTTDPPVVNKGRN